MNTKFLNFLFLTFLFSLASNTYANNIKDHPLYNIILSQISIMSEESNEKIGFDTIIGLLNELKNSTLNELHINENNLKNYTLSCETSNSTLNINLADLQKMLSNYTNTLNNLKKSNVSQSSNSQLNQEIKVLVAKKNDYIESFTLTNTSYLKFIKLANQSRKLISECGYPKLKLLNDLNKEKATSKLTFDMAVDEYTSCFDKYDSLLTDHLSEYDDTKNYTFKTQIAYYLNNSEYDCIDGNYILGMNSTLQLNQSIDQFVDYWNEKMNFYSNYTQQVTFYEAAISALRKRVEEYSVNNQHYDQMRNEMTKLIKGTTLAIENILKSISLLNTDCNMVYTDYRRKIQMR
jgi:hypothetical protein